MAYAGLMMLSARQTVEWGTAVCGNWLLIQLVAGHFKAHLFKPEDPTALDVLRKTARLPTQPVQRGGYRSTLPHVEVMHGAVFSKTPDWAWGTGRSAAALIWCGPDHPMLSTPPAVVANAGPDRDVNFSPHYAIGGSASFVILPIWTPIIPLVVYPAAAALLSLRRTWLTRCRHKRGLCLRCGYDLTGLAEPRCPECGAQLKPRR